MNKTKTKIIAKKYIENGLDMKKTAKQLSTTKNDKVLSVKASRWLNNPEINKEIAELLNMANIKEKDIAEMIKELKDSKETASYKGKITQSKTIANDKIRLRLLEILLNNLFKKDSEIKELHLHQHNDPDKYKQAIKDQLTEMKELGLI